MDWSTRKRFLVMACFALASGSDAFAIDFAKSAACASRGANNAITRFEGLRVALNVRELEPDIKRMQTVLRHVEKVLDESNDPKNNRLAQELLDVYRGTSMNYARDVDGVEPGELIRGARNLLRQANSELRRIRSQDSVQLTQYLEASLMYSIVADFKFLKQGPGRLESALIKANEDYLSLPEIVAAQRGRPGLLEMRQFFDKNRVVMIDRQIEVVPSFDALDIPTLNEGLENGRVYIGLSDEILTVDGFNHLPSNYIIHDVDHADIFLQALAKTEPEYFKDATEIARGLIANAKDERQKKLYETLWFFCIHEQAERERAFDFATSVRMELRAKDKKHGLHSRMVDMNDIGQHVGDPNISEDEVIAGLEVFRDAFLPLEKYRTRSDFDKATLFPDLK